ncbi:hypothetical protein P4O66_007489 [Electrophorus voltai]|uniref:Transmembrane protein 205 n=1 Tax=Electrophorus voltai TaxID=2609070 RepID=A0AAD9DZX0_9TELE|nr:hypothetical protein P4O66_007489 [Electrophorus voltai]
MVTEGDPTELVKVLHLLVIAFSWGMQVWVSFIAGFVLVSQVTLHTFGLVQSKLFPVYFYCLLGSNTVSLAIYAVYHPRELLDWHETVQHVCFNCTEAKLFKMPSRTNPPPLHPPTIPHAHTYTVTYGCALPPQMALYFTAVIMAGLNAQWFGPAVTENMLVMRQIEKEHGLGEEVGFATNRERYTSLREQDPKYKAHRSSFYRYHGLSNLSNLVGFSCTTINLIYLALHLASI